jgi:hypothetical protein
VAIERCGASPQLTHASVLASGLLNRTAQMLGEINEAKRLLDAAACSRDSAWREVDRLGRNVQELEAVLMERHRDTVDAHRWRWLSARMSHERDSAGRFGWTLDHVLPGDDPAEAVDADMAQFVAKMEAEYPDATPPRRDLCPHG